MNETVFFLLDFSEWNGKLPNIAAQFYVSFVSNEDTFDKDRFLKIERQRSKSWVDQERHAGNKT